MKKWTITLIALGLLMASGLAAYLLGTYQRQEGMRFVKTLGNGINLGGALEAYGAGEYVKDPTVEDYETFWHNPPISPELIHAVKAHGFDLVRIPVSWGEHMDENGRVDPQWMDRVETVVRQALAEGLTVILDTHHEFWLDLSVPQDEAELAFAALWEQIALRFSDCGEALLFEGWNEPRLRGSRTEWTGGNKILRAKVNRLNQIFVDTVRTAGGMNTKRWLLIPTYGNSTEPAATEPLIVPDRRCIVSLHIYMPYNFCQKEDGLSDWDPNGPGAEKLLDACDQIRERFTRRDIPVIITECACIDRDNEADRVLWVRTLLDGAERCCAPCIWWDSGGVFRLLDRLTGEALFPDLLHAFVGAD